MYFKDYTSKHFLWTIQEFFVTFLCDYTIIISQFQHIFIPLTHLQLILASVSHPWNRWSVLCLFLHFVNISYKWIYRLCGVPSNLFYLVSYVLRFIHEAAHASTFFLNSVPCCGIPCCLTINQSIDQRRQWHPTPVLLPGESQGQQSLVGFCLWGHPESGTTEATQQQQQQQSIDLKLYTHFPYCEY